MDLEYNITYRQKDKGLQAIISYKDNGKWKQKSKQGFENSRKGKTEAKNWAKNALKDIEDNIQNCVTEGFEGMTIGDLKEDFLRHIELHREYNTLETYITSLKSFNIDDINVNKLKLADVQKCIDKLVNISKFKTITTKLVIFKAMINYAERQYNIHTVNLKGLTLPSDKTQNTKRALEPKEKENLLEIYKTKNKDCYIAILLALNCGLRIGEVCGLTWRDIDFKDRKLNINKQWKIDKVTKEYSFGTLKSKESYRIVPIPQIALSELENIKQERFKDCIEISYKENRLILNLNTKNLDANLGLQLSRYNTTVHELRHTYATNLIANGMDFKTVAKLLGHGVEQTLKTYSHVTKSMMEQATELIDKIF